MLQGHCVAVPLESGVSASQVPLQSGVASDCVAVPLQSVVASAVSLPSDCVAADCVAVSLPSDCAAVPLQSRDRVPVGSQSVAECVASHIASLPASSTYVKPLPCGQHAISKTMKANKDCLRYTRKMVKWVCLVLFSHPTLIGYLACRCKVAVFVSGFINVVAGFKEHPSPYNFH